MFLLPVYMFYVLAGVVATGNVTIEDNHCLGPALINTYASGGISLSEGSGGGSLGLFLSHGVTLRGNSGMYKYICASKFYMPCLRACS
jgi:hypothetical protein